MTGDQPAADPKISIQRLSKVFGPDPGSVLAMLHAGASKNEILNARGHVVALNDINLDITDHSIQVIMGLSGSGKSTLVRHINRLIEPSAGRVLIDGRDVLGLSESELQTFRREKVSMVFQRFGLLPHRTVADNVGFGLGVRGDNTALRRTQTQTWIEKVGLQGYEESYPSQLSGGMQQRVGLARALAMDTDILLMDEPFSALDPLIRTEMQDLLLDLQKELKKTVLFITHDPDEAMRLGDAIAILKDGEIAQNGGPEDILLRPASGYIQNFTKDINRGRVVTVDAIAVNGDTVSDGPELAAHTTLAEAGKMLAGSPNVTAKVIDANGKILGGVRLTDIARAIARDVEQKISPPAARKPPCLRSTRQRVLQSSEHQCQNVNRDRR